MNRLMLVALPLALAAAPAPAQTTSGLWNLHYQNGISEYSTGMWDSPTGGALSLSCLANGRVEISAQIKGQAPPPRTSLVLSVSSRAGSRSIGLPTNGQGVANVAVSDPRLRTLWRELRARDIVTVRYSDGRAGVQSLAGAGKLLPSRPCG